MTRSIANCSCTRTCAFFFSFLLLPVRFEFTLCPYCAFRFGAVAVARGESCRVSFIRLVGFSLYIRTGFVVYGLRVYILVFLLVSAADGCSSYLGTRRRPRPGEPIGASYTRHVTTHFRSALPLLKVVTSFEPSLSLA